MKSQIQKRWIVSIATFAAMFVCGDNSLAAPTAEELVKQLHNQFTDKAKTPRSTTASLSIFTFYGETDKRGKQIKGQIRYETLLLWKNGIATDLYHPVSHTEKVPDKYLVSRVFSINGNNRHSFVIDNNKKEIYFTAKEAIPPGYLQLFAPVVFNSKSLKTGSPSGNNQSKIDVKETTNSYILSERIGKESASIGNDQIEGLDTVVEFAKNPQRDIMKESGFYNGVRRFSSSYDDYFFLTPDIRIPAKHELVLATDTITKTNVEVVSTTETISANKLFSDLNYDVPKIIGYYINELGYKLMPKESAILPALYQNAIDIKK